MSELVIVEGKRRKPRVWQFKKFVPKQGKKAPRRRKGYAFVADSLVKIWRLSVADSVFSREIKERDGKCLFPGCEATENLTCSHYFSRATKATRFDKDNCIVLCRTHHFWNKMLGWEFQKQREEEHGWDGRYTIFMKQHLGLERWEALKARAKTSIKQKDAIIQYMAQLSLKTSTPITP